MLLEVVPSYTAYNDNGHGVGYSYFFLRGFDMRRNAVTLNGVPLNDAESHGVFFVDLADFASTTGDIQVQRGVGTNLYGGSAIGGSIDFRTRTPMSEARLRLDTTFGSWGTRRWSVEYDSGLFDGRWAATFRYSRIDSDGYRDQSWLEAWNYYATVEHYGDDTTTRLVLFGGPERTHLAYLGIPKRYLDGEVTGDPRRDRRYNPLTYPNEIDEFFQPHYQLLNDWRIRDDLTLHTTLYYFTGDGFFEQFTADASLASVGLPPAIGPDGEPTGTSDIVTRRHIDEWDAGAIPTLEWRHGSGRGTLQAGLAARFHTGREWGETVWAASFPPGVDPNPRWYDYDIDKTTWQPFLQESWRLAPDWTLLAGLTWTSHTYHLSEDRVREEDVRVDYDYLLPRLGVTWRPTDDWSVYANVSRGGREPAFRDVFDPQLVTGDELRDLDPEELTDLELGAQHVWSTGYARGNLYWLDFDNAIVFAGGIDEDGLPTTANGAVVTQWGAELEAAWTPIPRWGGRLALSYADATFDEFIEYDFSGGIVDHSGNRVAGVSDWLATLELTGGIGPVDLLVTFRHVGEFFLDNTEDLRKEPDVRDRPGYIHRINPSFTTVDLSAEVSLGPTVARAIAARDARLRLRINNLTDELYTTFGYMGWTEPEWIPAATRSGYVGLLVDW
jgi:iron complex outermembrane receptor protein